MRRVLACSLLTAVVAVSLSGSAGAANSQTYTDATGDAGGGPDITSVTVANNDQGVITHTTNIAGGMPANRYLTLLFDAPPLGTTNYDYLIALETFTNTFILYRWDGASYVAVPTPNGVTGTFITGGVQFVFNRSVIGATTSVNLDVATSHENGDPADFLGERQYSIILDITAPDTTIASGPPATTTSTSASFTYTGTDNVTPPAGLTFECSRDNAAFAGCSPAGASYAGLSVGAHNFRVRARDAAGNLDASPASYSWTIQDTTRRFKVKRSWLSPTSPQAGKPVTVSAQFAYIDSGGPVAGGTASCVGRLGSKQLKGKLARTGGTRKCTFSVPAKAAGKRFRAELSLVLGDWQATTEVQRTVLGAPYLALVGPRTNTRAPLSGNQFQASFSVLLKQSGAQDIGIRKGAVRCLATVGGRALRAGVARFLPHGSAICAWDIPSGARGKTLAGRIVVRARGLSAFKAFKYTIR